MGYMAAALCSIYNRVKTFDTTHTHMWECGELKLLFLTRPPEENNNNKKSGSETSLIGKHLVLLCYQVLGIQL